MKKYLFVQNLPDTGEKIQELIAANNYNEARLVACLFMKILGYKSFTENDIKHLDEITDDTCITLTQVRPLYNAQLDIARFIEKFINS